VTNYYTTFFVENRQLKNTTSTIRKTTSRQLERSQFKESGSALAKPETAYRLSWWCSCSGSDSWSKGRWFDSRPGRYQVN